jgi:hypothetical protein
MAMAQRRLAAIILAVAAMILCSGGAWAQNAVQPSIVNHEDPRVMQLLKDATEKILKSMDDSNLSALNDSLQARIKEIGLSYDGAIPLSTDAGMLPGKTKDQLYILWGMYSADLAYALDFQKRADAIVAAMLRVEDIVEFSSSTIRDDPAFKNHPKKRARFAYSLAVAAEKDNSFRPVLNCGFYGATLEAFYILSRLGLASGISADYLALLNDYLPRLDIAKEMLAAYGGAIPKGGPYVELVRVLDTVEKGKVIESIMSVFKSAKGKLRENDLRVIISIVEKVRAPYLKPSP